MKRLLLVLPLFACDEVIAVRNLPPEVRLTAFCTQADGADPPQERAYFVAEVADHEGSTVDLDLLATLNGARVVLGPGDAGDGTVGLTAERAGTPHLIEWARTCTGEGCVDACSAERALGPSGVRACKPAPAALPEALSVTVVATDGDSSAEATFELTRTASCP